MIRLKHLPFLLFDTPWRIRRKLMKLYFNLRYSGRTPGIFYDHIFKVYVNSEMIDIHGDLYEILCETVHDNLIYDYHIGTQCTHAHTFDRVMLDAYKNGAAFSIPEEFRGQYSEQELSLLYKIAAQSPRKTKLT